MRGHFIAPAMKAVGLATDAAELAVSITDLDHMRAPPAYRTRCAEAIARMRAKLDEIEAALPGAVVAFPQSSDPKGAA